MIGNKAKDRMTLAEMMSVYHKQVDSALKLQELVKEKIKLLKHNGTYQYSWTELQSLVKESEK